MSPSKGEEAPKSFLRGCRDKMSPSKGEEDPKSSLMGCRTKIPPIKVKRLQSRSWGDVESYYNMFYIIIFTQATFTSYHCIIWHHTIIHHVASTMKRKEGEWFPHLQMWLSYEAKFGILEILWIKSRGRNKRKIYYNHCHQQHAERDNALASATGILQHFETFG